MPVIPGIPPYDPDPRARGGLSAYISQHIGSTASLSDKISALITLASTVLGGLAVIYLVYSGIRYITANGNQDTIKQARSGIVYAILGIIVVTSSYLIIQVISSIASYIAS